MAADGVTWGRIMAPVAGGDADAAVLAAAARIAARYGRHDALPTHAQARHAKLLQRLR